jgi:hypothetical protein
MMTKHEIQEIKDFLLKIPAITESEGYFGKWVKYNEDHRLVELIDKLIKENEELINAIKVHRLQKSDDRCWLDDQKLYAVLNDGDLGNNILPPKEKFLMNCSRYYDNRCQNGNWPSYQELQDKLNRIKEMWNRMGGINFDEL